MCKLNLKENNYSGKLIVFEGTDGAGKSTLVLLTRELLEQKYGVDRILCVKQPTDMSRKTKLFQKMMYSEKHEDVDYRAVQLLTMSDRLQHSFETIEPALKEGKIVLCDRYVYTSLANMLARGYVNESWFFEVAKHLINPNVVFLAYVEAEIAIRRIRSRLEERERFLDETLLKNVAKEFYDMSKRENFMLLDTDKESEYPFAIVRETLKEKGIV